MKLIVHRALSAALALSLCLSSAGAAWYGRDIQRQENGNYVLYEPYSDKNIIETPYHLYELTYIGSADGMAGVHSTQVPYYCAKNGSEIFLWNASGRNIVSDSGLRAAGFISDGGYMVVQNVQNGLYGVWSAEKGQLTVPCRYQSIRLLTGQYEGTEAPPPEIVVAATMNGQTWTPLRSYDGKVFLPGEFDEISTASGLLAVRKGGRTAYYDMREGTAAIPQTAANRSQMSAWAADEVEKAVMAELVPEELQRQYTKPCTRQEFCQLVAAITQKRTGKTVQQLVVYRGGTDSSFTDTDNADVLACASLGIVNGVGNGRFAPDAHITREQAATMLVRAAGILDIRANREHTPFNDADRISTWAKAAVAEVGAMQTEDGAMVMQGVGSNRFAPSDPYTREQSIMTAYRLFRME